MSPVEYEIIKAGLTCLFLGVGTIVSYISIKKMVMVGY